MIEFLSRPEWINPQMDFLVFLQNIRMNCSDIIDKFFLSITIVGEIWLPTLICAIIYWCFDFKAGMYLFLLEGFNKIFVFFFKMLACVYRPWILDSRIKPSELAIPFATGYSFPSGHSAMSSSVLGGCAYILKHKFWSALLVCIVLMVGFSRLWLGVHSIQDVIVGLSIGLFLVFAIKPMVKWAEKDKKRYTLLLFVINIFAAISLVYIYFFNTYRIDYVFGELLVDPQKMKQGALLVYMYALGLINGCLLCARFFPFNPKNASVKSRVVRGIVGSIFVFILLKFGFRYIMLNSINILYTALIEFFMGITITLIYPIIFTRLQDGKTE